MGDSLGQKEVLSKVKYIYRIIQILFNSSHNDLNLKSINLLTHSAHFFMQTLCPSSRYKMISEFTWPNHDLPSDKDAVKRLLQGCGFDHDVAYGKTKVFIRTPRTLFSLEEQRAEMVQRIVLFLQKVRVWLNLSRWWIRYVSLKCKSDVSVLHWYHGKFIGDLVLPN